MTCISRTDDGREKLELYLDSLVETGVCLDGALAQDERQVGEMWAVREGIPEACSKDGVVYKVCLGLMLLV